LKETRKNATSTSDVARQLSYKTKTTFFFQDQDRSGQDQVQDHFFKTKTNTALLKTNQIINPRPLA